MESCEFLVVFTSAAPAKARSQPCGDSYKSCQGFEDVIGLGPGKLWSTSQNAGSCSSGARPLLLLRYFTISRASARVILKPLRRIMRWMFCYQISGVVRVKEIRVIMPSLSHLVTSSALLDRQLVVDRDAWHLRLSRQHSATSTKIVVVRSQCLVTKLRIVCSTIALSVKP